MLIDTEEKLCYIEINKERSVSDMIYKGEYLNEISFPLGGIGTGSIGLGGDGRFIDWEIFNRPAKGSMNGYSHIAVRVKENDKINARVLNGDMNRELVGRYSKTGRHNGYGYGPSSGTMCGFPHFEDVEFKGEFPIAELTFTDCDFPGKIRMTAFNPFIPLDSYHSSLPAAFFEIEVENTADKDLEYQIAFTVCNPFESSRNSVEKGAASLLSFFHAEAEKESVEYGDLTIATDAAAEVQQYWYRGGWQDGIVTFWNEFSTQWKLPERTYEKEGSGDHGTVCIPVMVKAGGKNRAKMVLAWNIPNCRNYWRKGEEGTWKNYYATQFENSRETARYAFEKFDELLAKTKDFRDCLYASTLDEAVIDAASANLSVLKSPTVLRLEDGSFCGWEGCMEEYGSCEGTCQHVWNYAYALCFLFPELERSIRDLEFRYSTEESGKMAFRLMLPLGGKNSFRACVDGQMGAVFKSYREWKISGDDAWLRKNWDTIKNVLEYAWSEENPDRWDLDKDGVMEGRQHHTLDMELFGPSSWLEGMYLLALKTAAEMADYLGEREKRDEYNALYKKGRCWMQQNLFNGRYFVQKVNIDDKNVVDAFGAEEYWNDEKKEIKYQIADGCSIDQLLAMWHGKLIGIEGIFDEEQVRTALKNMFSILYKPRMRDFTNPWRIFSLNDESGCVICDYPADVRKPQIPIPYCEETMTGFEYQLAGLWISEGMIEEGLAAIRGIRGRYDGKKRNPWNEIECGSNYARSMASFALLPLFAGFAFDMPKKRIGFAPKINCDEFRCVFSLNDGWGIYEKNESQASIVLHGGKITLKEVDLHLEKSVKTVKIDGEEVDFNLDNGAVFFEEHTITDRIEICL